ncbi:MAG: decarboxylating NADP(+)-dependent phosphogluconate dehydrogenase [Actinomycetota bacterium]|nr:decarboxylating NADP(+)-dependent phosphogluconate dehydrogenase [Actinomycetota bacterium]
MAQHADIGLIGLAVMGRNLALNMADHDFVVAVYNRTPQRTDEFLSGDASQASIVGTRSLEDLVDALERPRVVMLMIKAGPPVDDEIASLIPLLERGDIIIDGGNSLFTDTQRRTEHLADFGICFIGMGISGGEDGARYGPSIMPGGNIAAWPQVDSIFRSIAAKADGEPCCEWVGPGGAGHYVKMVHNGIEYGDMQVIAEAYDVMHRGLDLTPAEMQPIFARWNEGRLDSFLIDITRDIMGTLDADGTPLLDRVLDAAGQKGTGKWTVIASMDQAMPTTLVSEAVYARIVSALVDERAAAARVLAGPTGAIHDEHEEVIADLEDALYASKIVSYAQGFMLFEAASDEYGWGLDPGTIASLWRAGCIIRSRFLNDITAAYRSDRDLSNLLVDGFFRDAVIAAEPGWRRTVARAVAAGIPVPAYSSALAFYDAYRSDRLPANLIQAQRDSFGAHTYERTDEPRGRLFHSDWTPR